jgi:metal-sulfur cluster biosynthetic enzyme
MGLGNMLDKLFKKQSGADAKSEEVLSPANALTDNTEPENIYETASLSEGGSTGTDASVEAVVKDSTADPSKEDAPGSPNPAGVGDTEVTEEKVLAVLSEVYDPEIPIDIVNLGLIYGIEIEGSNVRINMTMTAPGCPASTQIAGEAKILVEEMPGVDSVEIEIVWDPPWDPSKMSEEAQQSMGMF